MAEDLSDVYKQLRELRDEVRRLRAPIDLENSAIENGRMRFIGGLLRVDSGGRVEIVGTLHVEGTTDFVGPVTISGPWTFSGDGNITGDVDLTGNLEVLGGGRIKVGDVILTPGNGGRITIGTGSSQIVIDPSQLKVGPAFKMDPAHSSDGAQQEFGLNGRATLFGSNTLLSLLLKNSGGSIIAGVNLQPNVGPIGTGPGVELQGLARLATIDQLPSGHGYQRLVRSTENGVVYWFAGGIGGPGDGLFEWPFPLDQVTSEFRSPERPGHDGIDFGIGPSNTQGTPIPSAGSGVVEAVGTPSGAHGWGYYVLVNHGTDPLYGNAVIQTRYAHMYQAPPVSVGDPVDLGMTLGGIGNTGNSFGNHLHFEVLANGVYVNPRTFMAAHGG